METTLTGLIAAFVGGFVAYSLKVAYDLYISKRQQAGSWSWALDAAASLAVRAVEQIGGDNQEKLNQAIEFCYAYLAKLGFKFSEKDRAVIRMAVEAALLNFKNSVPPAPAVTGMRSK